MAIITALANDQPLTEKHHDHALAGDWADHRDCRRVMSAPPRQFAR
jgi:mRNA interferase YafQ